MSRVKDSYNFDRALEKMPIESISRESWEYIRYKQQTKGRNDGINVIKPVITGNGGADQEPAPINK